MSRRAEVLAPRPTGAAVRAVRLDGCVFPWEDQTNQPVLLAMPGTEALYLPVFSDATKLRGVMRRARVAFDRIKQIDDEDEFLDSIRGQVVVILDPWFTLAGTIRFQQVTEASA